MRSRVLAAAALAVSLAGGALGAAAPEDAAASWDRLLRRSVADGRVDYEGMRRDRAVLDRYLATLAAPQALATMSRRAQLAFWINAYNACVIQGVLDHTPRRSVKEIRGFFDGIRYSVNGAPRTLNAIEAQGRALGEWRLHLALVCAAASCPPLRAEVYAPDRLEAQLADQARRFLNDPARGVRVEGASVWASAIFTWYADDILAAAPPAFRRRLTAEGLLAVVGPYLAHPPTPPTGRTLRVIEYDWSLNAQRPSPSP